MMTAGALGYRRTADGHHVRTPPHQRNQGLCAAKREARLGGD